MSPLKPPASWRYLKARLQVLARPSVWASGVGLVVLLVSVWQYWTHPEWLNAKEPTPESNIPEEERSLSPEDLAAIGADIDSSPVLKAELGTEEIPLADSLPNPKTAPKSEGLLQDLLNRQEKTKADSTNSLIENSSQPNPKNPFAPTAPSLLATSLARDSNLLGIQSSKSDSSLASGITPSPVQSSNWLYPLNSNQNGIDAPVSPLQQALNQVTRSNSTSGTATTQTPAKALNQPLSTAKSQEITPTPSSSNNYNLALPTNQTTLSNPYSTGNYTYLTQPSSPSSAPSTTPANSSNAYTYLTQPLLQPNVPTAASVTPITSSSVSSPIVQSSTQNLGFNNSGLPANTANTQSSQLNQQNFSAPRPIPGRYIGGGQINTFSNP